MNNILHITYDLRDRLGRDKTTAVKKLINETNKLADVNIIDIVRVPFPREEFVKTGDGHFLINSFGLPYGLFLISHLDRTYSKIVALNEEKKINLNSVTHVHAHKLTYEGYIGWKTAKQINAQLFITLRQTDFKVLRFRPDLKKTYKQVLLDASRLFYIVPFMLTQLSTIYGKKFLEENIIPKAVYLPNIVETKTNGYQNNSPNDGPLITILRMNKESVKRKNIKNLFTALKDINEPGVKLNLIGDGDYAATVKQWAEQMNIRDKVEFIGQVDHSQINMHYSSSKAFVLPSRSESFGMVYAEALQNGTPILYSKGVLGFDGIFENVGCAVDPYSVESIKNGIIDIIQNNKYYRKNIEELKKKNAFNIFSPEYAYSTYKSVLENLN